MSIWQKNLMEHKLQITEGSFAYDRNCLIHIVQLTGNYSSIKQRQSRAFFSPSMTVAVSIIIRAAHGHRSIYLLKSSSFGPFADSSAAIG